MLDRELVNLVGWLCVTFVDPSLLVNNDHVTVFNKKEGQLLRINYIDGIYHCERFDKVLEDPIDIKDWENVNDLKRYLKEEF